MMCRMITWQEWVRQASDGASARQVASRIRVSPSSVATWFRTGRPPAAAVIEIARLYDADLVVGLISAGILRVDDVMRDVERRLRTVPSRLLIAELSRRVGNYEEALGGSGSKEWGT